VLTQRRMRLWSVLCAAFVALPAWASPPSFITFESGQVRPLALSADGARLFALNTPNGTLVIYGATDRGLIKQAEVSVGMEPVAVAVRSANEVWVVNHLSDSVSIVSLAGTPRVTRTLLVGDEPRDIVFAGRDNLAFITTAHRGQHRTDPSIADVPGAGDPQLTTPSIGRADVWVFDPEHLGASLGGTPRKIMTFFSDTPRALAVSPDRNTVYVAAFKSGNQTTSLFEPIVCDGFQNVPCADPGFPVRPGGVSGPSSNVEGVHAPETGVIVKFNNVSGHWEDELGHDWDFAIRFRLPDRDVFSIDARTLTQKGSFAHVGTTLFNMVTNPRNGKLYVSNTEALNNVRFEGPGTLGGSTVRGHFLETRISIISAQTVSARHLNKHIDYSIPADAPGFNPAIKNYSLSTPLDMAVTADGRKLFVAAFGSSKVGVFDTAALEAGTFNPLTASAEYLPVSGGGPSGLALDERRGRLYVLTRFDNSVKVLSLVTRSEIAALRMFNPEPAQVVSGRSLLYDARATSANGEASCAGCHVFGDNDDLAWDLGNPDGAVTTNPMPILLGFLATGIPINGSGRLTDFHPMKGPMTTQTLRGLRHHGAMHWRGDRATGPFGTHPTDAELSFNNFINAFKELLGRAAPISEQDMRRFTAFQLEVQLPPNPVRNLDNSLTAAQQLGRDFFMSSRRAVGSPPSEGPDTGFACHECHALDPAQGLFGTNRETAVAGVQVLKVPQLRNAYTKVGKFGLPALPGLFLTPDTGQLGDQIRGFAFLHDGFTPTLFDFFSTTGFAPRPEVGFPLEDPDRTRRGVEQFILAFDTDIAPIVGQQVTLTRASGAEVQERIDLLQERAGAAFTSKLFGGTVTECDLVAKVSIAGKPQGFLFNPHTGMFVRPGSSVAIPERLFRALARIPGQEITFTCVPPGSGTRVAAVH
jgi:DNA-binding beta-propeller fold protein YncE